MNQIRDSIEKFCNDIFSLYLNDEFADITLNVNGEKLYAHKVLLSVRSDYFKNLVHGESKVDEITINVPSLEAFKLLLKYIYSGDIAISHSNVNLVLEVLIQSTKFNLDDLQHLIIEKLKDIVNVKNVSAILNVANSYNLTALKDKCHEFLDNAAPKFLKSGNFVQLTQESLIEVLRRDTFFAPEIEIFKTIFKWMENNRCEDKSWIVPCLRLGWMSAHDIVAVVRPTEIIDNEVLLNAIAQTMGVEPKTSTCRGRLILRKNVASLDQKAEVLRSLNDSIILTEDHVTSPQYFESHKIGDKNGIIVKLKAPTLINYIRILLNHSPDKKSSRNCSSYYIEVSIDFINWKKIIDYSRYKCRGWQNLYFGKEMVLYIRIVGTYNSLNDDFRLYQFKARYKVDMPQVVEGIIRPDKNIATLSRGAIVIEGRYWSDLLARSQKLSSLIDGTFNYTSHLVNTSEGITIQLSQPYMLSSLFLMLYDGDKRSHRYYIKTSVNNHDWETVADFRCEDCQSVQNIIFPERPVVFIRIVGTYTSADDGEFRCSYFECPSHML